MSEEQLQAFLEVIRVDAGLREKLKGAADPDAMVAIAKEAGFEVSKEDWIRQLNTVLTELSDEELEAAAGGYNIQAGFFERMINRNLPLSGGLLAGCSQT